jgi:hypothetical protein
MKKLLITLITILITINVYNQTPPPPADKNGNFSKSEFSKNNSWSKDGKSISPPDPNGAGSDGGTRIPLSNGLYILIIGSTFYFYYRIKKDKPIAY